MDRGGMWTGNRGMSATTMTLPVTLYYVTAEASTFARAEATKKDQGGPACARPGTVEE